MAKEKQYLSFSSLFAFATLILCTAIPLVSAGNLALMDVKSMEETGGAHSYTMCVAYQQKFSEIPLGNDKVSFVPLIDLSDKLGCSPSDFADPSYNLSGSAVAVSRGDCSFSEKANLAQSVKVSSILIVDYKNSSNLPVPAGNSSKDYNEINITVATITWRDYKAVKALPIPVGVRIYAIKSSRFDPNMIIVLFGSISIILTGALWSIYTEKQKLNSQNLVSSSRSRSSTSGGQSNNQTLQISPLLIIVWVVFLVGILLCLYFFYDYAVYVFIALFCLAGSQGLHSCLWPIWSTILPFQHIIPQKWLFCTKDKVKITSLVLFLLCLTVGIYWAIQRHASYAWILQDMLGIAFCVYILRTLHLPSLRVITILSILLFIYDVFFVFITPLFTKNGESIMMDVATGGKDAGAGDAGTKGTVRGKSQPGEMVPMVFIIPIIANHMETPCTGRSFSILGFGDIVFPGLLVVYNALFDVHRKSRMVYFVTSVVGYLIGMGACLVGLVYMESGQPALFYLVPCTLIPTFAIALKRGELRATWYGQMKDEAKSETDDSSCNNSDPVRAEDGGDEEDMGNLPTDQQSLMANTN